MFFNPWDFELRNTEAFLGGIDKVCIMKSLFLVVVLVISSQIRTVNSGNWFDCSVCQKEKTNEWDLWDLLLFYLFKKWNQLAMYIQGLLRVLAENRMFI